MVIRNAGNSSEEKHVTDLVALSAPVARFEEG